MLSEIFVKVQRSYQIGGCHTGLPISRMMITLHITMTCLFPVQLIGLLIAISWKDLGVFHNH